MSREHQRIKRQVLALGLSVERECEVLSELDRLHHIEVQMRLRGEEPF